MALWKKWLASWYSGLAFSKFQRQKHEEAARLFQKVCKLDPDGDHMELTYSCLGRCFLSLKRNSEALHALTTAYKLYQKQNKTPEGDFELQEYEEFLRAYSYALNKAGYADRLKEINLKLEKLFHR